MSADCFNKGYSYLLIWAKHSYPNTLSLKGSRSAKELQRQLEMFCDNVFAVSERGKGFGLVQSFKTCNKLHLVDYIIKCCQIQ